MSHVRHFPLEEDWDKMKLNSASQQFRTRSLLTSKRCVHSCCHTYADYIERGLGKNEVK